MTDSSGWLATASRNPLYHDSVLFAMYMNALDVVLRQPEVRQACDEFTLPSPTLRMRMAANATRVLAAAPREFGAYLQAGLTAVDSGPLKVTHGSDWDPRKAMRLIVKSAAVAGVLMIIAGGVSSAIWAPMATLAEAGASLLVAAGLIGAALRFLSGGILQSLGFTDSGSIGVDITRSQLVAAVSGTELLAQVRMLINDARQDRFGHQYLVVARRALARSRQRKPGPDGGCGRTR